MQNSLEKLSDYNFSSSNFPPRKSAPALGAIRIIDASFFAVFPV